MLFYKFVNCGGRNRTCGLVVQSHEFLPAETTPQREEGRVGLEPTRGCLTNTCSAAELPTQHKDYREPTSSSLPLGVGPCSHVGIEPTCSAWKADTFANRSRAHVSVQGGSRGTRTHNGRFARTCFRGRLLIRPDDFHLLKLRRQESNLCHDG